MIVNVEYREIVNNYYQPIKKHTQIYRCLKFN